MERAARCECIVCGKALDDFAAGDGFQPDNGLAFLTYGHYGTTVFDPMDGTSLEIAVCDECVVKAVKKGIVCGPDRAIKQLAGEK